MTYKPFSPDELTVRDSFINGRGMSVDLYQTPITPKENMLRLYEGKTPMWIPHPNEMMSLKIDCDPENVARSQTGGIDGFGVEWVWEGLGAMVRPGSPKVPDINEWEKYITVPNPDDWDWECCYMQNKGKIRPDLVTHIGFGSCLFERLIAVMDFAPAAVALIDEEQQEAVHRFFRAVTDYRLRYYELCKQWFPVDILNFNDDWGGQHAPFFSVDTAKEMLVPYVKESIDKVHELHCYADLHCCGLVEPFVPFFIEEGFNSWGGQPLNDKPKLKRMYGDRMIFTHEMAVTDDSSEEEISAAAARFMEEFGYDNRGLNGTKSEKFRKKLYELSRKNFDRLVAEGKAIL